jgi:DNA-directed RNA polymerase specialized sigma24 family protein
LARKPRFSDEELDQLLKRLTAFAVVLFAGAGLAGADVVLEGTAMSPADLAAGTLTKLLSGDLKYRRSRGRLDSFLATVMLRDFIDLVRSKAYTTSVALDSEDREGEPGIAGHPHRARHAASNAYADPFSVAAEHEFKEKVHALVQGENDLEEMAYAVLELNATKPRDIAGLLKTDTADVQNRKKQMRRRLAKFLNRPVD